MLLQLLKSRTSHSHSYGELKETLLDPDVCGPFVILIHNPSVDVTTGSIKCVDSMKEEDIWRIETCFSFQIFSVASFSSMFRQIEGCSCPHSCIHLYL